MADVTFWTLSAETVSAAGTRAAKTIAARTMMTGTTHLPRIWLSFSWFAAGREHVIGPALWFGVRRRTQYTVYRLPRPNEIMNRALPSSNLERIVYRRDGFL
jgi:hypothetical protein